MSDLALLNSGLISSNPTHYTLQCRNIVALVENAITYKLTRVSTELAISNHVAGYSDCIHNWYLQPFSQHYDSASQTYYVVGVNI